MSTMNNFQLSHARILCALNKNDRKTLSARELIVAVSSSVIYRARRIDQLIKLGFVSKRKVNDRKHEYQLTKKGETLASLLQEFEQCTPV